MWSMLLVLMLLIVGSFASSASTGGVGCDPSEFKIVVGGSESYMCIPIFLPRVSGYASPLVSATTSSVVLSFVTVPVYNVSEVRVLIEDFRFARVFSDLTMEQMPMNSLVQPGTIVSSSDRIELPLEANGNVIGVVFKLRYKTILVDRSGATSETESHEVTGFVPLTPSVKVRIPNLESNPALKTLIVTLTPLIPIAFPIGLALQGDFRRAGILLLILSGVYAGIVPFTGAMAGAILDELGVSKTGMERVLLVTTLFMTALGLTLLLLRPPQRD